MLLLLDESDETKRIIYLTLIFKGKVNINNSKELLQRAIDETFENIKKMKLIIKI